MKTITKERVNADLYRAISGVLMSKASDPALQGATILRTELSDDGSVCDVFVTANLPAFQKATGFLRTAVAKRVNLRRMPRLVFILDEGQKNMDRVEELLAQIAGGKQQ